MEQQELQVEGWRKVVHFTDKDSGLNAIISVHNDALGPGCGGCRILPYESFELALEDVKNLSRGMTYKNALGGIPFGGGKAVIIADAKKDKTPALIRAFGRAVDAMGGQYYTAEDSGVTEHDIEIMQGVTKYAAGIGRDGIGGNPSPFTARGVWRGMQAAARYRLGAESLKGLKVSILGVGAVGMGVAEYVHQEGGELLVADINADAAQQAADRFGAQIVSVDEAASAEADIYSPCALGGSINARTIDTIKAKVIAGAANNQLKTPDMDQALLDRGILYAPDYVINAMGVISVGLEILGQWTTEEITLRTDRIGDTLSEIFKRSADGQSPTGMIADAMAMEVIARGKNAA